MTSGVADANADDAKSWEKAAALTGTLAQFFGLPPSIQKET